MLKLEELQQREKEAWTRCDFCCDKKEIVVVYHTTELFSGPIETEQPDKLVIVNDDGNWGACVECKDLIEVNDWKGLYVRALPALLRDYPEGVDTATIQFMWRKVFGDRVVLT